MQALIVQGANEDEAKPEAYACSCAAVSCLSSPAMLKPDRNWFSKMKPLLNCKAQTKLQLLTRHMALAIEVLPLSLGFMAYLVKIDQELLKPYSVLVHHLFDLRANRKGKCLLLHC